MIKPATPLLDDAFSRLQSAASHAATSHHNRRPDPTPAQAIAGNYKKAPYAWNGLKLVFENVRNSVRSGTSEDGKDWANRLAAHYGEIAGTIGNDGDPIDVFFGLFPESSRVWIINQGWPDGRFDEHKCMLGFATADQARDAYALSFDRDWTGLQSMVPLTVAQFKWWLKSADKSKPSSIDLLPFDGQPAMNKTLWNANAEPVTLPMNRLVYALRSEDSAGLLLDAVTMAEIMSDPDIQSVGLLDALVVEVAKMTIKMNLLQRVMSAAGGTISVTDYQISDPIKARGVMQVAVLFQLSDGQTVTIWLHNPDTTPTKLMPLDELISWKWMLNKKDITIVVAPEQGRDLQVREVARRIMRLANRNTEAFAKANVKLAEKIELGFRIDSEITSLEKRLAEVTHKVDVARQRAVDIPAASTGDRFIDWTHAKQVEDFDELASMGVVIANEVGAENLYFEFNGKPYFTKLVGTAMEEGAPIDLYALVESMKPAPEVAPIEGSVPMAAELVAAGSEPHQTDPAPLQPVAAAGPVDALLYTFPGLDGTEALVRSRADGRFAAILRDTDANETVSILICPTEEMAVVKAKGFVAKLTDDPGVLPANWTESYPGGMAAWNNPVFGGIVDRQRQSGQWFIIFNNDQIPNDDRGFYNRAEAFEAFAEGLAKITPAAVEPVAPTEIAPTEAPPEVSGPTFAVGDFLTATFARMNKRSSVDEYREELGESTVELCKVEKAVVLTVEEWDAFADNLMDNNPLLADGGTANSAPDMPADLAGWSNLTDEEKDRFRATAYRLVTAVSAPGRETFVADPQGYAYARYVGLDPAAAANPTPTVEPVAEVAPAADAAPAFADLSFEQAKAQADALWSASTDAEAVIGAFPKGPMGLTPDDVRTTDEWKAAKANSDKTFADLRDFNAPYTKKFKKELAASRKAAREAKLAASPATKRKDDSGFQVWDVATAAGVRTLQRMNATETMGLPGWHDVTEEGKTVGLTYVADTKDDAVREILAKFGEPVAEPAAEVIAPEILAAREAEVADAGRNHEQWVADITAIVAEDLGSDEGDADAAMQAQATVLQNQWTAGATAQAAAAAVLAAGKVADPAPDNEPGVYPTRAKALAAAAAAGGSWGVSPVDADDREGPTRVVDYGVHNRSDAQAFAESAAEQPEPEPAVNKNEAYVAIAADSLASLKQVDVERVLMECPAEDREDLAAYIIEGRPELADEVRDVLGTSSADGAPLVVSTVNNLPQGSADEATDRAFLNGLIDGTGDLLSEATFPAMEPMFAKYAEGSDMYVLLEKAAIAFGDAAEEFSKKTAAL